MIYVQNYSCFTFIFNGLVIVLESLGTFVAINCATLHFAPTKPTYLVSCLMYATCFFWCIKNMCIYICYDRTLSKLAKVVIRCPTLMLSSLPIFSSQTNASHLILCYVCIRIVSLTQIESDRKVKLLDSIHISSYIYRPIYCYYISFCSGHFVMVPF